MTVKFHGNIVEFTGGATSCGIDDCADVCALIDKLGLLFGEAFCDILNDGDTCFFLINGKGLMQTGGPESRLAPGDIVDILPFVEAG